MDPTSNVCLPSKSNWPVWLVSKPKLAEKVKTHIANTKQGDCKQRLCSVFCLLLGISCPSILISLLPVQMEPMTTYLTAIFCFLSTNYPNKVHLSFNIPCRSIHHYYTLCRCIYEVFYTHKCHADCVQKTVD